MSVSELLRQCDIQACFECVLVFQHAKLISVAYFSLRALAFPGAFHGGFGADVDLRYYCISQFTHCF